MDDIFVIKCAALSDGERVLLSILDKYTPGEKAGKSKPTEEAVNIAPNLSLSVLTVNGDLVRDCCSGQWSTVASGSQEPVS